MNAAAPIPLSPRAACAGSRRALGHGQPRDGISDWVHAASARRLPQDELLPLLWGAGPCPPGVTEQVGWEKVVVVVAAHPRALGGAVGVGWGLYATRSCCAQWRNEGLCLAWPLHGGWLSSPSCPTVPILSHLARVGSQLLHPGALWLTWRICVSHAALPAQTSCMGGCWWSRTLGQQRLSFRGDAGGDEQQGTSSALGHDLGFATFALGIGKEKESTGLVFQLSIDTSLLAALGLFRNQVEPPSAGV